MDWSKMEKWERERQSSTLEVCWNLIGHEGNISSVAEGLPVNKAATITKGKSQRITKNKGFMNINHMKRWRNLILLFNTHDSWSQKIMQVSMTMPSSKFIIIIVWEMVTPPTLSTLGMFKPPSSHFFLLYAFGERVAYYAFLTSSKGEPWKGKQWNIHALASSFLILIPCRTIASSNSPKSKADPWLLRNKA